MGCCMTKAFYASPEDLTKRIPELWPLRNKTVAIFGLGSLGAPSVLEFARAGMKKIYMIDYDIVDPATMVRWPFGFSITGERKTDILKKFILKNYPYTKPEPTFLRVGGIPILEDKGKSQQKRIDANQHDQISSIIDESDLIYDCTAEWGVVHFLTDLCNEMKTPYIRVSGTQGGWGGRVFRVRPYKGTGCWYCYEDACRKGVIPKPPVDKDGKFQPVGCADPTFTGAGFDMVQIAIMGVKMAISTLCEGEVDAYPSFDEDAVHIHMRNEDGSLIAPEFKTYKIERRVGCEVCNGKA